jgi:hypothetical protein
LDAPSSSCVSVPAPCAYCDSPERLAFVTVYCCGCSTRPLCERCRLRGMMGVCSLHGEAAR